MHGIFQKVCLESQMYNALAGACQPTTPVASSLHLPVHIISLINLQTRITVA